MISPWVSVWGQALACPGFLRFTRQRGGGDSQSKVTRETIWSK